MSRKIFPLLLMFLLVARIAVAAVAKCTISGQVVNADGSGDANDTITITPYPSTQIVNNQTVSAQPISVQTDASGNVTAFSLIQGLNVFVTLHNSTAAPIATFVPSATTATWGQFLGATLVNSFPTVNGGLSLTGSFVITPVGTPTAPIVTVNITGSTTYTYYCVAQDSNLSESLPSTSTVITNGAVTANNTVTCGGQTGATGYRILKTNTSTSLGTCATLSGNACSIVDTGQATAGYVAKTIDQTGGFFLANSQSLYEKDSGGTYRSLFYLDSSNVLQIGGTGISAINFANATNIGSTFTTLTVTGAATINGLNLNNYSLNNVGQANLVQLPPPSGVTATATCTGTCATAYSYKVTCFNDIQAETLPSLAAPATNAASLSSTNFNVLTWGAGFGCNGGYNVYGRVAGSLVLLANVPNGTTTYKDTGAAAAPAAYTFTWSNVANPVVAVWDLRGVAAAPSIDATTNNSGTGTALTASGFTTNANHDLQIPLFATLPTAGTFTPPGGFSNAVSIPAVSSLMGLWGGTKDIAAAGAVGNVTATTVSPQTWTALDFAFTSANPAAAITVVGTASASSTTPFTNVTFSDPVGTLSGDTELVCAAWGNNAQITTAPTVPAGFYLIATVTNGAIAPFPINAISCYLNFPSSASAITPPTSNRTGILQQSTPSGNFSETMLGIQHWTANNGGLPNGGSGNALATIAWPMPLTVVSCRATWNGFAGCSPFPSFQLRDSSAGVVLCTSGLVTGSNTDTAISPANTALPANDVLVFFANTSGTSCTAGLASMSIILKE